MKNKLLISFMVITFVAVGLVFVGNFIHSPQFKKISNNFNNILSGNVVREIKIRSGEELLDPEALAPIIQYFELSAAATADLNTTDITQLFSDPAGENAWINQSALNYLINLRLSQSNDLRMTNYEYGLTISEVNDLGDQLEVTVMEDRTVNFAFIPDIDSSSSGIKHTFYLTKDGNHTAISGHHQDEDYFFLLEDAINANPEQSGEIPAAFLAQASASVDELSLQKQRFNSGEQNSETATAQNPYDAAAAINYAMTWVNPQYVIRNTDVYGVYDQYDGNCNNYISQCLHAGGIPMDDIGDQYTQWKWYDDDINLAETDAGRSPAWAGVDEFYAYASQNTGFGLVAVVGDNVFSGAAGDILQYGFDNNWHHSVFITAVIRDDNGKVLDYLINSNTTDRINYPASAYGYPEMRLIKIMGWNNNPAEITPANEAPAATPAAPEQPPQAEQPQVEQIPADQPQPAL